MTVRILDEATRRAMAVTAQCDPRTIDKVMAGEPVRGISAVRAHEALTAAGLKVPPLKTFNGHRRAQVS
jgi:hypothetical protein